MKDRAYYIFIGVLAVIALSLLITLLVILSQVKQVDCDNYNNSGTSYKPLPKQCMKGEQ